MKKPAPLRDWPRRYPNLPLYLSVIALLAAIVAPIAREFLARMT